MINTKHPNYKTRSKTQKQNILTLHTKREESLQIMAKNDVESSEFQSALEAWIECNLVLQSLWGFKQNKNYFKFWELPKCKCPKLDNNERYPLGNYIISGDCKVHNQFKLALSIH